MTRFGGMGVALWLVGCAARPPSPPSAAAPPAPLPESAPPAAEGPLPPAQVRFDDLGLGVTIPPGMRAVGDDELAARVRATATPQVRDLLRARVAQKRALPLLTLVRDGATDDWLTVTLSVLAVPRDASAAELLDQQQGVMQKNLTAFTVTSPAEAISVDGVPGAELAASYRLRREGRDEPVASRVRVFVRDGLATLLTSVWSARAPSSAEGARDVAASLRFYAPDPAAR